jgi:ESCRT-I complex subunit TSG101
VADDNAISDTMYFLAKALNSERIDLAVFMKVYNVTKKKKKKKHSFIFVFITKSAHAYWQESSL